MRCRIQRLMLCLQKYDLTFEIPDKHLVLDTLSGAGLQHDKSTTEKDVQNSGRLRQSTNASLKG